MIPVRFTLEIKTTNPLNGSFGLATRGAQMGAAGRRKKHRKVALEATVSALKLAGLPTQLVQVPALTRKGEVVRAAFLREVVNAPEAVWCVELVRLSAGKLDDDAVGPALKSVRDGIADALAVNDGNAARVRWSYEQRKCAAKTFGVEITIGIRAAEVQRATPAPAKSNSQFNLFQERAR